MNSRPDARYLAVGSLRTRGPLRKLVCWSILAGAGLGFAEFQAAGATQSAHQRTFVNAIAQAITTATATVPTVPPNTREQTVPTVATAPREQTVPTVPKAGGKAPAKKKQTKKANAKPQTTTPPAKKKSATSASPSSSSPPKLADTSIPKVSVVAIETTGASDTNPDAKSDETTVPTSSATKKTGKKVWLSAAQRKRADQLISVFENSTPELQYAYAENLDDGRGLTLGRAGFTTGTCDALEVIRRYGAAKGTISFARFGEELNALCDEGSGATDKLPQDAFVDVWKQAAKDPLFRTAQDATVDDLYYGPAMTIADHLGIKTVLARLALYDTAIQHGVGDDPDGLEVIVKRTNEKATSGNKSLLKNGAIIAGKESEWLTIFLNTRSDVLKNPSNRATANAWSQSVDRVKCLQSLLKEKNVEMKSPLTCSVYGTDFTIK